MLVFGIIFSVLIIVFLTPLRLRIITTLQRNDVDLYIVKFFNLRIDIDELINDVYSKNPQLKPTLYSTIQNSLNVYKSKNFITSLLKKCKVRKVTFILRKNFNNDYINSVVNVFGWIVAGFIRNAIIKHFYKINDEYYMVDNYSNSPQNISFELILEVRIIFFLYSLLVNYREIPKLIKLIKKGSVNNE